MVSVPSFVSANARRGLELLEFAGDGLQPKTVREARQMASGDISADKVRRMAAWLARHATDLNSPRADDYLAGRRERPTPGQVAWLLWGGDIGKANRDRAQSWAERKVQQLIREGELDKASPGQIKAGVTVQFAVPKPPDPTEYATGIVDSVARSGTVTVGGETIEATADDPVALVVVYARVGDEFQETDRVVPKKASELKVVGSIADKIKKQVPARVKQVLQAKVEDHNAKNTGAGKRVTLRMLEAVYERGIGAYRTNPGSVRPTVTSAEQWAYGRVNAFLTAVRTGRFPRTAFDTDLLPSGHPLSSKKTTKETTAMDPLLKQTKREDGEDFPAEAFAYVPDPEAPSTWKLRLWDSLSERETPAQVGRAVAALGAGFRGQRVELPADAVAGVKQRVLQAWLDTHPDMTSDDAPSVLKGYGYEMKDDDMEDDDEGEYYDPLQSMLDAYGAAVRMGAMELAEKIQPVMIKVQAMYPKEMGYMMDKNGGGYKNPLVCLTHAYLGLLMWPESGELRQEVMTLIHDAEGMIYGANEPGEMDSETDQESGLVMGGGYSGPDRLPVQRVVRQEGNQWCVYSETTGRSFGCYATEELAGERLRQIEQFATAKLVQAEVGELVAWHDKCHAMKTITPAVKLVHDLIEDQLESLGHARPYDLTADDKLELLISKSAGLVRKAEEQRYTLGPWYVPGVEDAHGEFTDEDTLQKALWDWVKAGDRTIYLQHGDKPAGEMVEIMTVPFAIEAELAVPNQGVTKYAFPANTPFMGVIWEPWAWEMVKAGKLRGYSIGGSARRMEAELPDSASL